jgi:hypothetical protein
MEQDGGYWDSLNLYQADDADPIGFADPDGTDPRIGVWSGINSRDQNGNLYNYFYDWNLPFPFENGLSNSSTLTTWTTGPWPFAQENLNNEAQNAPNPLPDFSSRCPVNIEILMISPATDAGSPADGCGCCKIHGTLLFDPYDNALSIAGIQNTLEYRQQQMNGWGQAIPIDIATAPIVGHYPGKFGPFPIFNRGQSAGGKGTIAPPYRRSGNVFDPGGQDQGPNIGWFKNSNIQKADFAFVCHSQGCNMLLNALQRSCKRKN